MPYLYILECADGSYYTGSTWDLEKRLWEHQNGLGAKHTAKHLPVTLVYCEECERIEDAYTREKQIQGWSRKKKQALMAGDMNKLHSLAECKNDSHHRNFGFDSAHPTETSVRSLSRFVLNEATDRSLSGAEGNNHSGANE